jgi:hypothetical protein
MYMENPEIPEGNTVLLSFAKFLLGERYVIQTLKLDNC